MVRRIFLLLVIFTSLAWLALYVTGVFGEKRAEVAAASPGNSSPTAAAPPVASAAPSPVASDTPAAPAPLRRDYVPHDVIAGLIGEDGNFNPDSVQRLMAEADSADLDARVVSGAVVVRVPGAVLVGTEQRARFADKLRSLVRGSETTLLVPRRFKGTADSIERLQQQIELRSGTGVGSQVYEPDSRIPREWTGIEVVLIPH